MLAVGEITGALHLGGTVRNARIGKICTFVTESTAQSNTVKELRMMLKHGTAGLLLALSLSILGCNATDVETGTVTLRWQPPVESEDGTPLTDLAGYRVYWGPPDRPFVNRIDIDSPQATSYVLDGLSDGEWRLAVSSVTERAVESKLATMTVFIKDGETTVDEATLGKVITRHDEDSAASRNKRVAKP